MGRVADNVRLAYPIVLSGVGMSIVQFFDTLMVGQVNKESLAGVAFASAIIIIFLVFGQGMGMAQTPLVGQAFARKETKRVASIFQNAILQNIFIGIFIVLMLMLMLPFLHYFGQEEEVIRYARPYFIATALSLLPAQIFLAFRHFMEGVGNTKVTMIIIISANILNIILNYIFIFGKLGLPAMGAFGAGLSTLVARTLMPIAYVVFILSNKKYRRYTYFFKKENLKLYMQKNILRLGAPIAVQQTLECFSFSMVTIMMGWFSAVVLAAYQIVTTFFTMTFQISCGVASATTILVSHSYGRKDYNAISEHSKTGVILSIIAVGFFGLLFILIPDFITSMFTDDVEVIKQAAPLFLIAGIFQVIDGTQVTLLGALRGMNDVNKPMKYSLFGYILIALPLAYVLGFIFKLGPCGTFSGIAIGLLVAALLYKKRLQTIIKIKKNSIFAPQN